VPRALISVADKAGLIPFARGLAELGWELYASGGTHRALTEAGLSARTVEELGGIPEVLAGRVKTLQAQVHAAILARPDRPGDLADLRRLGVEPFGLVCVNLYPFFTRPEVENIDIGGVALLRAAAKNHEHVVVVCRPEDYDAVLSDLRAGGVPPERRRALALAAFRHTATYDAAIAAWLAGGRPLGDLEGSEPAWPAELPLGLVRVTGLRYGENPHQRAALYRDALPTGGPTLLEARQLQGKELSYNNLLDAEAAWDLVWRLSGPAAVAVKHGAPCGAALGRDAAEAFLRARDADPVSIFGGIVAWNRPVDGPAAEAAAELFLEVVVAPEVTPEAAAAFRTRKNLRVLVCPGPDPARPLDFRLRRIPGGLLVQDEDRVAEDPRSWRVVTRRRPTPEELTDLAFAWEVVRAVSSNAIVLARGGQTVGLGGGQPNRIDAARLALQRAGERARGAVLASDGFFPFPDVVEAAAQAGVTAVVQPGGSVRDRDSVQAADAAGMAMVFTGTRHFRH
jgi:phosphoribosylaminoimidazolecarboxamide formyltransferase/IMP cyclohydrolase